MTLQISSQRKHSKDPNKSIQVSTHVGTEVTLFVSQPWGLPGAAINVIGEKGSASLALSQDEVLDLIAKLQSTIKETT